ncbi:MAG: Uma2 family endonuclease [Nodosilinea sp.]
MATLPSTAPNLVYPESDGKPLADNTVQFRLIVMIQGGLDALFKDDPNVFVAGDLFWYPVEGEPWTKTAPDVMVAVGRPKGDRRSYKQWQEGDVAPQVVFEIASESNSLVELEETKRWFYERYGVEEYYVFDPDRGTLKGWQRQGNSLTAIAPMVGWVSPRLGVRFELENRHLRLYAPSGQPLATYVEMLEQQQQAQIQAEQEQQRAEQERVRAEQERVRAEQAEQAQQQAVPKLLALGLSLEQVAATLSLPVELVRQLGEKD